jgi:hypothetical protein
MGSVTPISQTGEGTSGGSCLAAWKIGVQLVARDEPSVALMAKNLTHHANELEGADVAHPIVDPVGVFAGGKNAFVPQDGEMLGDIALGSPHIIDDILYADLPVSQGTEDLEPKRVRHGLQRTRGTIDVIIVGKEFEGRIGVLAGGMN